MSYRLINANAIAIKYPEVNDMPCVFADLQDGLHGQFIEERKKGEWLWSPIDIDGMVSGCCSECSFIHIFISGHTPQYNYCPNCGADMRGDDSR